MKDLSVSGLLDVYGEFLSEKQRTLTAFYYNDDLSLSEIAENEGITRQAVNDIIKRTVAELKAFEEKCGYGSLFSKLKGTVFDTSLSEKEKLSEITDIIDRL